MLGTAKKATTAEEFAKLPLTTIPFPPFAPAIITQRSDPSPGGLSTFGTELGLLANFRVARHSAAIDQRRQAKYN